jgi:glutamyl/glutaminyl-tRNA synthetase
MYIYRCIYIYTYAYKEIHIFKSNHQHRPIEESLREFENMKNGKYGGSDATLRMKMDMTSPNPNMWDQVSLMMFT